MATWAGRPPADRDVFRAVADPTRRTTLEVLQMRGEMTVTALTQAVGVEMPTLSRHLAILRSAELVTEQRVGRQRIYRLRAQPLEELYHWAAIFHKD